MSAQLDAMPYTDALRSPNAIPPRTSSTGMSSVHTPPKDVLKPVPEADWIAGKQQRKRTVSGSAARAQGTSPPTAGPTPSLPAVPQTLSKTPAAPTLDGAGAQVSQIKGPRVGAGNAGHLRPSALRPRPDERDPSAHIGDELINQTHAQWSPEKEQILFGPFDYLFAHPGKDIRSQLISAFNAWLKVPPESLAIITKVVGMLHTASLLIDDVEDSSLLRRGIPVAHSIFGTPQTLNSSNYVYFIALRELALLPAPNLRNASSASPSQSPIEIYTEEMLNLHRGQGMDLFWRDTLTCPSEADYLEMVNNKTGGLFRLAVKLMQACSPIEAGARPRNCVPLVNLIGLIFQIRDDYLNLSSPAYTTNKGLCEDLTEGKFSFPVIHSIRSRPNNLQLVNILKQRSTDEEVKRYAVSYMEGTGSFEYCRGVLRGLEARARRMIEQLDCGEGMGGGVWAILEKMNVD